MKRLRFHRQVIKDIEKLDPFTRNRLADLFSLLAAGENLGLPVSRPMPDIISGAHELRLKDRGGQYRVFYFTTIADAVLVFHFIKKKTQTTPHHEMEVARLRLKEMMS